MTAAKKAPAKKKPAARKAAAKPETRKPPGQKWSAGRKLRFAQLLFEGRMTQRDAFLEALPQAREWTLESQNANASLWANRPEIKELVEALNTQAIAAVVKAGAIDLESHLSTLADLRDRAAQAGDYGSAVRAEERRGMAGGLYIERKQVDSRALVTHEHRQVRAVDALMADALRLDGPGGDPALDGEERSVLPDPLPAEAQRH